MALRFSLTTTAAPVTPATIRGAWDVTTGAITGLLGYSPAGTASTRGQAVGSITANTDVLWGRWVSAGALYAGTLSGTASWIVGVVESNIGANAFFHVHIYVTTGDTDTPRGTVLTDNIGGTEFTATATGRGEGAQTLTSVDVQVGDRLVVEIGYQASADTTARTATMNYGNVGTADLTQGSTSVTTLPGYVEFSGADNLWAGPIGWLADTFDSGSIDAVKWANNFGTVSIVSGRARVQVDVAGSGFRTAQAWKLNNSAVFAQVPTVPVVGGGATIDWEVVVNSGHSNGVYLSFHYDPAVGTLEFVNAVAFSEAGPPSVVYSAVTHKWMRYRCDGVNVFWETSPDGMIWTTQRTLAAPSWVLNRASRFDVVGSRASGTTDFGEFDFVNVPAVLPKQPALHRVVPSRYARPRPRAATPVPAQVILANPTYPPATMKLLRGLHGWLLRRPRDVSPVPPQVNPPYFYPQVKQFRGMRGWLLRRRRPAFPVPPQVNPPYFFPFAKQPRGIRGWLLRRGRSVTPVQTQAILTAPATVPAFIRVQRRVAGLRRRVEVLPPLDQATVSASLRPRTKPPVPRRRVASRPPPDQVAFWQRLRPRPRPTATRRPRVASPPVAQDRPPFIARIRNRIVRLMRGRTRPVVPPQVILIAPPTPLHLAETKRAMWMVRRRRAGANGWMSHSCHTLRPSDGITPRASSGTTARPGSGTTGRPNTGVTARPNTGITEDPC